MDDTINGSFELFGGFLIALSCRQLWIDKKVRGVSVLHMGYFASWGLWNLYYYPSLGQWLSFWGGLGVVAVNCLYVAMIVYYNHQERRNGLAR